MVHGDSTRGTSGQEKVYDTASTVALTGKKHHDAAFISTLKEEHFLTFL